MPAALIFHTVDAFTTRAFTGNPAAVIVFSDSAEDEALANDEELMQNIAAEVRKAFLLLQREED
jgi:predicted PhzF superfamily epimerase YddE/YHI9